MVSGAAILTMILSAATGVAAGSLSPVDLTWVAPRGCPDAEAIRASIRRGLPDVAEAVAGVHTAVSVSRVDADHWRAQIDLRAADWSAARTLEGPTCAAVANAAGLVIALALNNGPDERDTIATSPPPAAAPSPAAPPPPAPPSRSSPFLGLAAVAEVGELPVATVGGALSAGWRLPRTRVELAAGLFWPRRAAVSGHPDLGVNLWFVTLDLRACYLLGAGDFALGPCVAAGIAWTRPVGIGRAVPLTTTELDAVAGAGARGEWRMSGRVGTFALAEAAFPLSRPELSVQFSNDVGRLPRAAAVSLRCAAGLDVRFW
jgi:hypothetical protein